MKKHRKSCREFGFGVLVAAVTVLICLGAAELAMRIAMPGWRNFDASRFLDSVQVTGFGEVGIGRVGFAGRFAQNDGDFDIPITINAYGLRMDEPVEAAQGRVWIVGDSFAFGWGVETKQRFGEVAGHLSGQAVYNIASPGTDVCGYQALIARMPKDLHPSAVVVALTLENDLHTTACVSAAPPSSSEAVSWWKSFLAAPTMTVKTVLTAHSALYNTTAVVLKRADAVRRLLQFAGVVQRAHSYSLEPFGTETQEAIAATSAELVRLRTLIPPKTPLAVLIVPSRFDIRDQNPDQRRIRETMSELLRQAGITVLDPAPMLAETGFAATHFAHDGHWSAQGHLVAGTLVSQWLAAAPSKPE